MNSILFDTWNKKYAKCPTCLSPFLKEKGRKLYIQLKRDDGSFTNKEERLYCSDNCIEVKLDTLNATPIPMLQLRVISKKKIMGDCHIVCEPVSPIVKVE